MNKTITSCSSFRTNIKKLMIKNVTASKKIFATCLMIFSMLYFFNESIAQVKQPAPSLPNGSQPSAPTSFKKAKPHVGLLTKLKSKFAFDKDRGEEDEEDGPGLAAQFEFNRTKDPATGTVPSERLLNALDQTILLQNNTQNKGGGSSASLTALSWTERGPYTDAVGPSNGNTRANSGITGGRVRAIMVDSGDVTQKTVWVGGVDGGLWKTTDITVSPANWILINDYLSNLAVSGICQDPTNFNTMYFCTGESYYNFEAVAGVGVFKSTDHGVTWTLLPSTSSFTQCTRILCDAAGNVYLATRGQGLRRSTNGGITWTNITPTSAPNSDICDLELSSTGRLHMVTGIFSTQAYRYTDIPATVTSAAGWNSPATAFPSFTMRAEIAVNGNILYAAPANGSYQVPTVYKSVDGGANWAATAAQPGGGGWANGQGWYSLSVRINPADANQCIVGGLDNYKTTDGGATWSQISVWVGFSQDYVHADQHELAWWDGGNKMLFGCDGGVHYSADGGTTIRDRNIGLRVKQFYSVAIHPSTTNYFLAGAQDNGTHQLTLPGLSTSVEVTGGDGAFVAIDQDQPQFQFGAYVYNQYRRSTNSGANWSSVNFSSSSGQFINPFDYDNTANIMYCGNNGGDYRRWTDPQTGSTNAVVAITALNSNEVTALCVSPYTANRVYLGTNNSSGSTRVCYVDGANTIVSGSAGTNISTGLPTGVTTSCIATGTDDSHLMVCFANYGVQNIWVSSNGGTSWTACDGNLPDMPVRWCMYFPGVNTKAYIATETGVWETDLINGGSTVWASNSTFPTVRTDMIKYRSSDRTIAAATHGRGVWTATVPLLCDPPVLTTPTVTQPTCAIPTGTIVVNATNASTMEYSIDNGATWQLSSTFSGLAGGNYNIIVRLQSDTICLTVYPGNPVVINTVNIPNATISASNGLALNCLNTFTVLTVPTPGGTTQIWTLNGNFFASAFNPLVTVGGLYEVTVTHTASGCTASSSVTVTLDNTPPNATISATNGLTFCNGDFTILTVPTPGGTSQVWTLNGNFFATAPNPLVTVGGVYGVTVTNTANGCTATSSVTVVVNPNPAPPVSGGDVTLCASALPATLVDIVPNGINVNWWDAVTGGNLLLANSATYSTSTAGTYYNEAVDPLTGCISVTRTAVTLTINPNPAPPVSGGDVTLCASALPATLVDIVPNGINVNWWDAATGGTLLLTNSPTYVTSTAGTYYNEAVDPLTGCVSVTRTAVTLTVNPNPAPPVSGGDVTLCASSLPATLVDIVPNGINVNWWDAATGGTLLLANSATYVTSTAGAYYNEAADPLTGCVSVTRTAVTLTVNPNPAPPVSGGDVTLCASLLPATLVDIVPNGINVNWWDAATGGTLLLANSPTYVTSTAGTYYNEAVDPLTGCVSVTRTAVTLTINPNPAPPVSGGDVILCASALPATLVDIVPNGINVNWWDAATGGTLLLANSATYNASTAGTYYNEAVDPLTGCISVTRTAVTLTVNPNPNCTITGSTTICTGGSATWCASGGMTSYLWSTGASTQCILVSVAGTYTVTITDGNGCTSICSQSLVVNAGLTPSISGALSFCANSSTILDAGAGYSFYLWSTGESTQTISVSTSGTFTVTVSDGNGCTGSAQVITTANPNPAPPVSGGDVTLCASALPATLVDIVPNGINVNWWDAATGGTLLLANSATYVTSTAGTYYNEAVDPLTGCASVTRTAVTLIVNPNPAPPVSGGDVTLCASALPATLVDIVPNGIDVNWWDAATGGTLLLANSATYVTSTAGTYYNEAVDPLTGCISVTRTGVTLIVNPNPAPPVSGGDVTLCASALPATLVDIVPNGINVNWWDAATGGTLLLANSATYVTSTAGTYFNEAVDPLTGCVSVTRTAVTLTINPNPAPPVSGGDVTLCASALPATLVDIVPGGINVNWWSASTGGTLLLANSATYVTSTAGIYYNEAVNPLTGCVSVTRTAVTLTVNPNPAPPVSGGNVTVCATALPATLVDIVPGGINVNWWSAATGGTLLLANSATYVTSTPGTYYNEAVNPLTGCISTTRTAVTLAVSNAVPAQPGVITGATAVCKNSNVPYSIALVPGATSYTWTATSGASVSTGQGSNSVVINFSNTATNATLSVVANNYCGSSIARTLAYVVSSVPPSAPATINGTLYGLCNQTNVPYNCPAAANAVSYSWTVPAGVTILTGQGTTAITVKFTGAFTTSGVITVKAVNGCGSSAVVSRTLNAKPQQPVISGLNWACKGQAGLVYSVAAIAGATSYTWTIVPGSILVSGQGTTSIVVNWGAINGVIKCTANNACGNSLQASFSVAFTCKEAGTLEDFSELSIFPNPATTSAEIQFDGYVDGKGQLAVYDLIGQQIFAQDIDVVAGNNNHTIDLSSLAKGAYMVRVTYNGVARNCKLILQ